MPLTFSGTCQAARRHVTHWLQQAACFWEIPGKLATSDGHSKSRHISVRVALRFSYDFEEFEGPLPTNRLLEGSHDAAETHKIWWNLCFRQGVKQLQRHLPLSTGTDGCTVREDIRLDGPLGHRLENAHGGPCGRHHIEQRMSIVPFSCTTKGIDCKILNNCLENSYKMYKSKTKNHLEAHVINHSAWKGKTSPHEFCSNVFKCGVQSSTHKFWNVWYSTMQFEGSKLWTIPVCVCHDQTSP